MNIGLLGFGVVGRGVYDMLADRDDIRAAWVLCRRDLGELTAKTTYDIQDILSDPAVDTVVEVMGRHAGHMALNTGIACGAVAIVTEETPMDINEICARIFHAMECGKHHFIIVVSEGVGETEKMAGM